MPGVRIQHPTERDVMFTLASDRPYLEPFHCPPPPEGCARIHEFKTYHIRLDGTGAGIVSVEIVERLKQIPGQPFTFTNEVKEPPAQTIRVSAPLIVRAAARNPEPIHQSVLLARQRRTAAVLRGRA